MTELTEIDGVGESMAKEMEKEGFESAEDVADASSEELQEVKGIGSSRAEEISLAAGQAMDDAVDSDEVLANHYNPTTGEYEQEMEYYCEVCERGPFNSEAARDTHQQRCDGTW